MVPGKQAIGVWMNPWPMGAMKKMGDIIVVFLEPPRLRAQAIERVCREIKNTQSPVFEN